MGPYNITPMNLAMASEEVSQCPSVHAKLYGFNAIFWTKLELLPSNWWPTNKKYGFAKHLIGSSANAFYSASRSGLTVCECPMKALGIE